jgi:hypothetical protein
MSMGTTRIRVCRSALLVAALLAALPAAAEMYKWTDDNGVVTYSNTPPTAKQPKKIEAVPERVSVYTPDAQLNKAMSSDARRDAKIAKLEKQIEAERRARQAPAQAPRTSPTERQSAAYERCVADRGVDCEAIRNGASASYGAGYPYVVVGARTPTVPFAVLSTPDSVVGINPAPPVGVNTTPPVGISTAPKVGAQPPRNIRSSSTVR